MASTTKPNPIPDSYRRVTPCLIVQGGDKVYVEDVDDVVARAMKRGAELQRSPQDQLYGDRDSYIIDPFGHGWTIATHVEDVEPTELMRRIAAMQRV